MLLSVSIWTPDQQQAGILPRRAAFPDAQAWQGARRHLCSGMVQDVLIMLVNVTILSLLLTQGAFLRHWFWGDAPTPAWGSLLAMGLAYLCLMLIWRSGQLLRSGHVALTLLAPLPSPARDHLLQSLRDHAPGLLRTLDAWETANDLPLLRCDEGQMIRTLQAKPQDFRVGERIHARQERPFDDLDRQLAPFTHAKRGV